MNEWQRIHRVLVTGWPSFLHGGATAGDVLAMEAAGRALAGAGIQADLAWSPVLRPGGLTLALAAPDRYSHLVFACGPLRGTEVAGLHRTYANCRRIAVGVTVTDPADPAVTGFHAVLARDRPGQPPRRDLSAEVTVPRVPVAGVVLAPDQPEYGARSRHERVTWELTSWLAGRDCGRVALDARLDPRDWRHQANPAQFEAVVGRLDVVVTTRLHGLVLALKNGIPVVAADPVLGGGKVSAQAQAWDWPAVVAVSEAPVGERVLELAALAHWWDWCLSPEGAKLAGRVAVDDPGSGRQAASPLTADLLRLLA